jgi:N6-adenosine-specific RNA methylase IME4
MADPPWKFGDKLPGKSRGASKHYACMSLRQLMEYELPPLDPNCLLFLWRVAAMQNEALTLMTAWGFTLKSEIVWNKLTKRGNPWFGMGRYVRAAHETCLIGVRGSVQVADHSIRSSFSAPVQEHSRKPDEIYTIAERLVPQGPYVELFGRRPRKEWIVLGNEVEQAA